MTRAGTSLQCADPRTTSAGAACCDVACDACNSASAPCMYDLELISYSTNAARCAADGQAMCPTTSAKVATACGYKTAWTMHWTSIPCTLKVQVDASGWVSIVHDPWGKYRNNKPSFGLDSANVFRVAWQGGRYPQVANDEAGSACGGVCETHGATCVCPVAVHRAAVFAGRTLPSRVEVEARLTLGAMAISTSGGSLAGSFVRVGCTSTACDGGDDVEHWRPAAVGSLNDAVSLNEESVLCVVATGAHYLNVESTVVIGGSPLVNYTFRNPPHFVSFTEPRPIDAAYETEALLDHLFTHPNVAPFIAHRLIQRLVTSNPTPRYVKEVARAFNVGSYGSFGDGVRGDLGAMVAAVLLDREARSATLDADPTHGVMREPLLKILHLMRSLEVCSC